MKDGLVPKKEPRVKAWDVILIILLLIMPGIRGYRNWELHEYIFLLVVIGLIIYSWITGDCSLIENNRRSPQDTQHDGES